MGTTLSESGDPVEHIGVDSLAVRSVGENHPVRWRRVSVLDEMPR